MPYELNKDRYHNMDKGRTLNLISPCDIEIPINKEDYSYFIKDNSMLDNLSNNDQIVSNIFNDSDLKEIFKKDLHLSLIPDFKENTFFIGYSPKEMIASIYKILGIESNVNIKYSNPIEFAYQRKIVTDNLSKYIVKLFYKLEKLNNEFRYCDNSILYTQLCDEFDSLNAKYNFAKDAINNVDYIFDLYNYRGSLEVTGEGITNEYPINYRNLSQYLAITSLREYEKNNNELYLEYPYKFYEKCSRVEEGSKQMLWVEELLLEDEILDSKFINFNSRFEKIVENSPLRVEFLLHYKDNNKLTVLDTLNPSSLMLEDEDFGAFLEYKSKKGRKIDRNKENLIAERQLASKIKFYAYDTEFSDHVLCRLYQRENNDTGYVGFILDNDYIVLDKFFKESVDGKCIPAKDASVYALPIEMYEKLGKNSGNIRAFMKNNPNCPLVIKKNHTESESYTKAVLKIAKRESASRIKAEDYIISNGGKVSKNIKTKKKTLKTNKNKD